MRRVIYASSAAIEMTPAELRNISIASHRNNARDGISGMLLYGDQSFFQVLEGEEAVLEQMVERIWADPRHAGISTLRDMEIEARNFPDWTMGCYRVDGLLSGSAMWPILTLETILDHVPATASPEVTVLARTFFKSIAPHGAK